MKKAYKSALRWLLDRAGERSTWLGLVTVLGSVGVTIAPHDAEVYVAAAVALAGVIGIMTKEALE